MLRTQASSQCWITSALAVVFLASALIGQEPALDVGSPSADASPVLSDGLGRADAPQHRIAGQVLQINGQPAARATLQLTCTGTTGINAHINADDRGLFEIVIRCPTDALQQLQFIATSHDAQQAALHRFARNASQRITEGFTISLENVRTASVVVTDPQGVPVADANVNFQLAWPHTLTGISTDATGHATVRIPASERIEAVMARKDHVGLDYHSYTPSHTQTADVQALTPEFPQNQPERLVLTGARPLTIQFVDAEGEPLEGVSVYPWLLRKPDADSSLNLSMFGHDVMHVSNERGEATFAWLPAWQQQPVTFQPSTTDYELIRINYDPTHDPAKLRVMLHRLVPVRGRVTDPSGKPISDIAILAIGSGRGFNQFRDTALTDAEGRYELLVAPNQVYLLVVDNPQWAAAPQTGFAVYPDKPQENRNFQLREATRVFGQLLDERTQDPIPNEQVTVYQYGLALHEMPGVDIPNPDNERYVVQPIEQYHTTTNELGEFEFRLGTGNFDIRPPQHEKVQRFTIADESELEMNVTTVIEREVELVGLVIDKERGKLIAGAKVYGVPRNLMGEDWQAETGEDGKFRVRRREQATYVKATNSDGSLAAIVEMGDSKRTFIIQLEPTGSLHGRLIDRQQKPVANQKLQYGVDVPDPRNQTWTNRFGKIIVTDARGEFEIRGLAAGWEYHIYLPPTPQGRIPQVTRLTLGAGEHRELGDLRVPDNR